MTTRRSAILIATALAVPAASLSAQQLAADVAVYGGHVSGHVVIASSGYRPIYEPRPHPAAPRVVVLAPAPRVVVVQRVGWGRGHWRRHGYREVVVYYDAAQNRYFTGLKDCRGFKQVVVYERNGRYYLPA
ncbi:MAG TPA: hypothetical protein VLT17_03960 [Gemmatimonadales bacterium]|jgi:hypothetical protein|nr:hypothetical protein [Gemmatimonadales bacterium]